MARKMRLALSRRQANPPASAAFIVLGLLLLTGTFIFAQAIGQWFNSTLPPAMLTYAGFAALGFGWWYLPRARGLQIAVGAPVLLLAAIGGLLLAISVLGELLELAGIGGGHGHAAP